MLPLFRCFPVWRQEFHSRSVWPPSWNQKSLPSLLTISTNHLIPSLLSFKIKMDALFDEGVHFIVHLQKSWAGWEREMLLLSKIGDPRNSFLIYFPLFYHWNHNLGVSVLWTAVISEWLNLILKWWAGKSVCASYMYFLYVSSTVNHWNTGGVTLLYKLYRCVSSQGIWFLSLFVQKMKAYWF